MSEVIICASREQLKKKVKIEKDGHCTTLLVMRNGYQWNGTGVDDQLLKMIRACIDDYFETANENDNGN